MEKLLSIGTQDVVTYAYGLHKHEYWEITYYLEGDGVNITDGVAYPFKAGTIICQPPEILHEDKSEHGYKNLFFEVDSFLDVHEPLILQDNDSNSFLAVAKLMYQEYFEENDPTIISYFIAILNSYLMRWASQNDKNSCVEEMKREIFFHYSSTTFNILDCFKDLPWSESQLRRYFKNETGLTPQKYLEQTRMRQAKKFLTFDSYKISQVAFMCGYPDPYYFSRAFKKYTGASPSEYRRHRKKKRTP